MPIKVAQTVNVLGHPIPGSSSQGRALYLPVELWALIAAFLTPHELMCLTQTSQYIRRLCDQRIAWDACIQALSISKGIFLGTYACPASPDECCLLEIKKAALAGYRLNRIFAKSCIAQPLLTRSLNHLPSSKHFLVPGGRYLITASPDCVVLWDLGLPGIHIKGDIAALAREVHGGMDPVQHLSACADSAGRLNITIGVEREESDERVSIFFAYTIKPTEHLPRFTKLSTVPLRLTCATRLLSPRHSITITNDSCVVMAHFAHWQCTRPGVSGDDVVIFWNMKRNRYALRFVPIVGSAGKHLVTYMGNLIALFNDESVKIWRLKLCGKSTHPVGKDPVLISTMGDSAAHREAVLPLPDCSSSLPFLYNNTISASPVGSKVGFVSPASFPVIFLPDVAALSPKNTQHYRLRVALAADGMPIPEGSSLSQESSINTVHQELLSFDRSSTLLVAGTADSGSVTYTLSYVPRVGYDPGDENGAREAYDAHLMDALKSMNGISRSSLDGKNARIRQKGIGNFSLCEASGRVAYWKWTLFGDDTGVLCVDDYV